MDRVFYSDIVVLGVSADGFELSWETVTTDLGFARDSEVRIGFGHGGMIKVRPRGVNTDSGS